jgi:multiple sugar transport system permease protein
MLDPQNGIVNAILVKLGLVGEPVAFFADLRTVWPSVETIIVWNTVPLIALSLLASLQSIPDELNEAAALDGATRWQQFRYITLPFLTPTLVVLTLMSVFWTFNNFVYVWLATGAGPGTFTNVLATEIYIKAFVDFRIGYSSAVGIVMAIVMAAFGLAYYRFVAPHELKDAL